jgi:hypothetical protein
MLHNIPEVGRSHLHCSGSLKSCRVSSFVYHMHYAIWPAILHEKQTATLHIKDSKNFSNFIIIMINQIPKFLPFV